MFAKVLAFLTRAFGHSSSVSKADLAALGILQHRRC